MNRQVLDAGKLKIGGRRDGGNAQKMGEKTGSARKRGGPGARLGNRGIETIGKSTRKFKKKVTRFGTTSKQVEKTGS